MPLAIIDVPPIVPPRPSSRICQARAQRTTPFVPEQLDTTPPFLQVMAHPNDGLDDWAELLWGAMSFGCLEETQTLARVRKDFKVCHCRLLTGVGTIQEVDRHTHCLRKGRHFSHIRREDLFAAPATNREVLGAHTARFAGRMLHVLLLIPLALRALHRRRDELAVAHRSVDEKAQLRHAVRGLERAVDGGFGALDGGVVRLDRDVASEATPFLTPEGKTGVRLGRWGPAETATTGVDRGRKRRARDRGRHRDRRGKGRNRLLLLLVVVLDGDVDQRRRVIQLPPLFIHYVGGMGGDHGGEGKAKDRLLDVSLGRRALVTGLDVFQAGGNSVGHILVIVVLQAGVNPAGQPIIVILAIVIIVVARGRHRVLAS